jgi:hypothetical protein
MMSDIPNKVIFNTFTVDNLIVLNMIVTITNTDKAFMVFIYERSK